MEAKPREPEAPLCSLTENFWREQPIAAALQTFPPSTGLKLTRLGRSPWTASPRHLKSVLSPNYTSLSKPCGCPLAGLTNGFGR